MPDLLVDRSDHVVTITLNRPDRLNAISGPMLVELSRVLVECDGDRDVRAIVITGSVPSYYLKQLAQETILPVRDQRQLLNRVEVARD